MPRNQNAGNLALRNRNRVTNKTRLKVVKGNIDADPIVLDDCEERARVISTAGVDAEDANEHHLQAVLSAASHRATTLAQRTNKPPSSGKPEKAKENSAFIPVPDAAGVVEHYAELYPSDKWVNPSSYVKFSNTIDDCISMSLVDGFTYFMDERDAEWLEKNNQDARGEGSSTSISSQSAPNSGTTTRSGGSHRSAKSKGKDAETNTPVAMAEDEFELVMGLFEKITHDNTPFLHVQGTPIPAFSDYQEIFANDLPPSFFSTYMRPPNLPQPPTILRMARTVYPHWRERRSEREGHRIIPALNFDESDVKNESYICFRRREIKAVRKTRTAQVSSSDKLIRLRTELSMAFDLARTVLMRETHKRACIPEAQSLWEKRLAFIDLKKQFPALGGRDEEDLLLDKERVPKARRDTNASQILRIKNRASGDQSVSPTPTEPLVRPKEKFQIISNAIEEHVKRQRERNNHWDDQIDNPYQQLPVLGSERLFRPISALDASASPLDKRRRSPIHLRQRIGRGGRIHFDRKRLPPMRLRLGDAEIIRFDPRTARPEDANDPDETMRRLSERWRYDSDLASNETGTDEEDRTLVDDFETKYVRYSMHFLQEGDQQYLITDPRLFLQDGQTVNVVMPFKASTSPSMTTPRKESIAHQRPQGAPLAAFTPHTQPVPIAIPANPQQPSSSQPPVAATPVAVHTPVKKMPPPAAPQQLQQARTPSNGPQRPASVASQASNSGPASSPPNPSLQLGSNAVQSNAHASQNMHNGIVVNSANPAQVTMGLPVPSTNSQVQPTQSNGVAEAGPSNRAATPVRPKSQNQVQANMQQMGVPNGFPANGITNGAFAGFPNNISNNYAMLTQQHAIALQQAQQLKRFAANQNQPLPLQQQQHLQNGNGLSRANQAAYAHQLANGLAGGMNMNNMNMMGGAGNMTLKLPTQRQMQWSANQRGPPVVNGNDALLNQNLQLAAAMNGGNAGMVTANGMAGMAGMNGMGGMAQMAQLAQMNGMNGMNGMAGMNGSNINGMNVNGLNMNGMPGMVHSQSPNGHLSPPNRHAHAQSPNNMTAQHNQLLAQSLSPHMGSPAQVHLTPPRNMQPTPIPGPQPSPLMQHQHIVSGINQGQGF